MTNLTDIVLFLNLLLLSLYLRGSPTSLYYMTTNADFLVIIVDKCRKEKKGKKRKEKKRILC